MSTLSKQNMTVSNKQPVSGITHAVVFSVCPAGCQDMVAEFRSQEIDGQALLLLTEEHLMSAMNIKLGPALKICSQINSLKRSLNTTTQHLKRVCDD
uniref:SAM domain-containing protein n=1 Tax=Astyanax mexicanus TaxID=7994 RepID=A0A8B9KVQ1_ASTMX